jgi:formylglycine-generating enzyme required for sulfatase activity
MGYNHSDFKWKVGEPELPVEMVSYPEAIEFCERLSAAPDEKRAGLVYRLPTEAEWEYACRANSPEPNILHDYAWFTDNSGGKTHPVGTKKPNAWGLYDMHGNVWEWCEDYFHTEYYRFAPEQDPRCTMPSEERVLRGGGWGEYGNWRWCRSAARGHRAPNTVLNYHGFRVTARHGV